jgi:hypothetical protein
MNIIDTVSKLDIFKGKLVVRKCVDDSGDYNRATYDILNAFPWGSNLISGDLSNPIHAKIFAASPEMLNTLIWFICPDEAIGSDSELINKFTSMIKPLIESVTEVKCKDIEKIKFSE